jgi:MYXO-CTERM domain-containing protein
MDNAGGSGVVLVQFLVDGSTVAQTATSPYSTSFNSAIVANGDHAFTAKAWDGAGNFAVSAVVMARTMNDHVLVPPTGGTGGGSGGATGGGGNGESGIGGNGKVSGGCSCHVPGAPGAGGAAALSLLALVITLARRRSR